jgi:hypothetical protein
VATRQGRDESFAQDGLNLHIGSALSRTDKGDIDLARLQRTQLLGGAQLHHIDDHSRAQLAKFGQDRRDDMRQRDIDARNVDAPGRLTRHRPRMCHRTVGRVEDFPCVLHQGLPGRSEPCAPGRAMEQRNSETVFHKPDLLAQRSLCDAKPLGGLAEMELFRKAKEVAQMTQIDTVIHMKNISNNRLFAN